MSLDRRGSGESGWRTQPLGSPAFLTASLVLCTCWSSLHLPEYSHQAHVTPPTPSTLPRTHTHTHTHTPHMTHTQRHVTPHRRDFTPRHVHTCHPATDARQLTPQTHNGSHHKDTPYIMHTPHAHPSNHTHHPGHRNTRRSRHAHLNSSHISTSNHSTCTFISEHRRTSYHAVNTQCLTPSANTHISHSPNTSHHCTVTDMTQHHSPTCTPRHCTNTLLTDPHSTPSLEEEITL